MDEIEIDEVTPKKLIEALIEKHDYYINQYSNSLEGTKRLNILKEKKDQLEHWVKDDPSGPFKKEYESTKNELETLEKNMISTDLSYNQLSKKHDEHKKAKKYWVKRLKELSNE